MSSTDFARCACTSCNLNIEFPLEGAGMVITCPHCEAATELRLDSSPAAPVAPPAAQKTAAPETPLTVEELDGQFAGAVPKTPTSIFYQFGLVLVTITMLILPVIYVGLIALAGYGVFLWATKFTFLLGGRGGLYVLLFKLLLYATPLISGVVVVLFMIKPLLARRPDHAQPLALNPQNEPVLFAYVSRICAIVGAPPPTRVDIDCNLNASASFRRGLFSMFGNDLVLTIGLPLVAGLDTRQLAGVIAHEFGHFTQGFGMRLTYLIRKVNAWFARVVYQRDAWDVTLEELATEGEDWRLMIMYNFVRLAVWFSRFILKLLMWIGHGIGCFMLRQMEYDADSYEIKVAGTECFEGTFRRMHVLDQVSELAYRDMRIGWNSSRTLPDNFPQWMLYHDARLDAERRTKLEDTMGFQATGLFDTHPSNGDRIKQARRMGTEGIFQLETPATRLFANFDVVAKQVTMLHYEDDLGIPNEMVKFMPVPKDGESLEKESPGSPAEEPPPERPAFKSKLKLKGKGSE